MLYKIFFISFIISSITQAQTFKGSFNLTVLQEHKNKNLNIDTISYFFGEEKTAIIIHAKRNQPDLRIIFTPADSTITSLFEINGIKGGYILPMNDKYWPTMKYALGEKDVLSDSELNYTEIIKLTNNYTTNEVSCSNDRMEATFWIAEEIELSLTQVMAYQFVGSGKEGEEIEMLANCGIKNLSLYTNIFDKVRNSNIILQIENLSTEIDAEVFNISDYNLSDMRK